MSTFSFTVPTLTKEDAAAADADAGDEGDNEPVPEEESTATFTPVVQLEVVEVKTFEEDEDIIYVHRAKLFIFGETLLDKGTGVKTWRERGVGEVKLLKHKENNRIRVLMRQEKTMKVLANHFLDPRIQLVVNSGNDKSWVWNAFDFAEGELVETTFALRFQTADIAKEFRDAFVAGQAEMRALMGGLDAKEGQKEADEAAAAIESLGIKTQPEAAAEGATAGATAEPEAEKNA